jgi:hypothetical protein
VSSIEKDIESSIIAKEPVIAAAVSTAALGAVGGFAVTHGWIGTTQDGTLVQTLTPVVTAAVLLGIGWLVRKFVTPTAKLPSTTTSTVSTTIVGPPATGGGAAGQASK